MSIFNEEQIKAMFSREYICHECGHLMEFEDEWEDTLPEKKCWALQMMIPRKIQTIKNIS